MRALKIGLLSIVGLISLLLVTIIIVTATIDPNDYKADIESAVAENTTLKLSINGELGWSFIPLGIDVNGLNLVQQDDTTFTRLNQLTAEVGLLSLLKMNPQVHRIILDGLEVTLEKNEAGEANWNNIIPKEELTKTPPVASTNERSVEPKKETSSESTPPKAKTIQLEIEEISITNTTINYIDKQSNQAVSLKDFNLLANNIALDNEFPLDINFSVANSSPQLDVAAQINAAITINSSLKQFSIKQLKTSYKLSGAPFNGNNVDASFNGNSIVANLENETISLDTVVLAFANLSLSTDLTISNLNSQPQIDGVVSVKDFSLQSLLSTMGLPKIETTDPDVLQTLAFSTPIKGTAENLTLDELSITLDDTRYTCAINYKAAGQFVKAHIKGTQINADRYLPPPVLPTTPSALPASDTTTNDAVSSSNQNTSNQPEPPLLPLETIRALNLDISFIQQQLIAKNLTLNDLTLKLTAKDGVISLSEASGKLYEGSFNVNAEIDATTDNPSWKIKNKVDNIQIMPLLKDFKDLEVISGGINLNTDIKTSGNTLSSLRSAAKGNADFNFDKGALHGFNLTKLACEGVALINHDKVAKTDWEEKSEFQAMKGNLTIDGNLFTNNDLTAAMSGLALKGKGAIDVEKSIVDYGIDLKAIGDLGDNACRVNDKIKDLAIPVICKGSLTDDPAKLCKLDYKRMNKLVVAAGKKELKRKADKEIDKQLKKYLGDDESDSKESVKKLFKGLFQKTNVCFLWVNK